MKQKTIKTIAKRFKLTSKNKIVKVKSGQNHLNSKETGKTTRQKRKNVILTKTNVKNIKN